MATKHQPMSLVGMQPVAQTRAVILRQHIEHVRCSARPCNCSILTSLCSIRRLLSFYPTALRIHVAAATTKRHLVCSNEQRATTHIPGKLIRTPATFPSYRNNGHEYLRFHDSVLTERVTDNQNCRLSDLTPTDLD